MGRLVFVWLAWATVSAAAEPALQRFEFSRTEMAVPIQIILYADDAATARRASDAALDRFHELNSVMSDYDPQSELRRLCDAAGGGKPVPVSNDLWRVLVRAQELSERSEGAFDITIWPLVHVWRSARGTKELPSSQSLQRAASLVDYRLLRLDSKTQAVELLKPKMRLDLGGIAKGYAVDEAIAAIRRHGITRMLIKAGGNIGLGEPPPNKAGWRIGIAPPDPHSPPRLNLSLSNIALSTSGDMWQYAIIGGKRYSHLVDPRTATALTDHCMVTVVGTDGLGTDGLSCAVAILGPDKGLKLIEDTPGAAALIIKSVGGKEETYTSVRWKILKVAD